MISTMRKVVSRFFVYLFSVCSLILVVELLGLGVNNRIILPSMIDIFKSFFQLIFTGKTYLYIGNTIKNLIISLAFSFLIGMVLGILAGNFLYVRLFFKPWITLLRSIPLASSLVIIMVLAGLGKTPYFVCSIMLIPMIYEGFCQGILKLDSNLMDVWKLNSRLSLKVILKVHIPLISTAIQTVFISSVGMGIKVIIMAEYLAGIKNTLGSAILPSANMLDYASVYAYSMIMVIVVLILESLPKGVFCLTQYIRSSVQRKNQRSIKEI